MQVNCFVNEEAPHLACFRPMTFVGFRFNLIVSPQALVVSNQLLGASIFGVVAFRQFGAHRQSELFKLCLETGVLVP